MHERITTGLSWIHLHILSHLAAQAGPIAFEHMRAYLIPERATIVSCLTFDMVKEGLISMYGNPRMISITAEGRDVLFRATARPGCT